jgi:diacylglycerol O-acyltransferase
MAGKLRTIGIGLGALWLWWRHFGPEIQPHYRGVQERPVRITGRTVVVGQHEFFVRETGPADAPPVVLIHGWVYGSLGTWFRVAELLAEDRRVVMIDHRNHGRSDRIRGRYEIETAADEVAGVMDAIGISSAPVVGYSMGGMITQALARRHPGKVERMVLAATAAFPVPHRRYVTRIGVSLGRAVGVFSPDIGARLSYHYLQRIGAVDHRNARWLWETLMNRDTVLFFEGGRAIWRFDSRPWVGQLPQPTLVIIPTDDQLVPPPAQYELGALIPDAEVVELVGARHEAVLTRAEDIAKAVLRFVDA